MVAPPLDELLAFWREVDRGATGEAVPEQFDNAVYRLQARTLRASDPVFISQYGFHEVFSMFFIVLHCSCTCFQWFLFF